jgi:GlpG protein
MFSAIEFPEDQPDLNEFSFFLSQINFPHRLSEQSDKVVLWVYQEEHIAMANQLYQRFLLDPQVKIPVDNFASRQRKGGLVQLIRQYPVTLGLVIFCILGFYICLVQKLQLMSLLSFQGFIVDSEGYNVNAVDTVQKQILDGQFWRLITPVFLHFDIMHLTFNATILWFLGHQIENREGSFQFVLLVIFTGVFSNVAQYYFVAGNLFGGMSGVNYGLLSYCAYRNFTANPPTFLLPTGFLILSIVMMLLGFLNVFALLGYSIANWAHLAGFVAGLLLAMIFNKKPDNVMNIPE